MAIAFGPKICSTLETAESREWLVTNGIGGYASGTIAGLLTRRYHGLLIAALNPPLGRTLLLTKLDETVLYEQQTYALHTNRWADRTVDPQGYRHLEGFYLEGTVPVWRYACGAAQLEKRIWMQQGANTTYVQYSLDRTAAQPLALTIKVLVNYRDHHSQTHAGDWQMDIVPLSQGSAQGVCVVAIPAQRRYFC
jgi:predicted glycogen debranching enzyme